MASLVHSVTSTYIQHITHCPQGYSMNLTLPPRVTDRAYARLAEIAEATGQVKALRVAVEGGGCSGFQYDIRLDDAAGDDLVLEKDGQRVLVDAISLPFLQNAVIDFSEELIGARFVIQNPNATASCGCGTSFSI
jgi:iron-sulfur cluster insertion protein